jgi:hypothetical protein
MIKQMSAQHVFMDGEDFASGMETNALMDESDIRLRSLCDIEELKQPIFHR